MRTATMTDYQKRCVLHGMWLANVCLHELGEHTSAVKLDHVALTLADDWHITELSHTPSGEHADEYARRLEKGEMSEEEYQKLMRPAFVAQSVSREKFRDLIHVAGPTLARLGISIDESDYKD